MILFAITSGAKNITIINPQVNFGPVFSSNGAVTNTPRAALAINLKR